MKKYLVVALSVGGMNNKIYELNNEVTADCFPEGHAEELVEKGFLKPIGKSVKHVVTAEDLENNKGQDLSVGEEIEIPVVEKKAPAKKTAAK